MLKNQVGKMIEKKSFTNSLTLTPKHSLNHQQVYKESIKTKQLVELIKTL